MNYQYQEQSDLVGVVRGYMDCNKNLFAPITNEEIEQYVDLARDFRDAYKQEKEEEDGTRAESECVAAVRARVHLPERDYKKFYPDSQCDYRIPERVFLLACVAVTGSRQGATTLSGIALFPRRAAKGLREHINEYVKGTGVLQQD